MAKHDQLCELAEEHELDLIVAIADGVVTPGERDALIKSAAALKRATARQAVRIRLGMRMIRGGGLDREIGQEVADYRRLLDEEKAASLFRNEAA